MSERRAVSQYHSFVMLGYAGKTHPRYCIRYGCCVDVSVQLMAVWDAK